MHRARSQVSEQLPRNKRRPLYPASELNEVYALGVPFRFMDVLALIQSEAVVGLAADAGQGTAPAAEEPPARVQVAIESGVLIFDLEKLGVMGEGTLLGSSPASLSAGLGLETAAIAPVLCCRTFAWCCFDLCAAFCD